MAGLPVAGAAAFVYLVLVAVHRLGLQTTTYAVVLAGLMIAIALTIPLMLARLPADTVNIGVKRRASVHDCRSFFEQVTNLSEDEEDRLIKQLENELDDLERRYQQELGAMQGELRNDAGPLGRWRRPL